MEDGKRMVVSAGIGPKEVGSVGYRTTMTMRGLRSQRPAQEET